MLSLVPKAQLGVRCFHCLYFWWLMTTQPRVCERKYLMFLVNLIYMQVHTNQVHVVYSISYRLSVST